MTLADMCRLCAESVGHCISVFGEDGNKYNLEHKIRVCSPITIKQNDKFPTQICITCLSALDQTYEFHLKIKRAQLLLKAADEDLSRKRRLSDAEEQKSKKIKVKFGSTTLTNLPKPFDAAQKVSPSPLTPVPDEPQASESAPSPKTASLAEAPLAKDILENASPTVKPLENASPTVKPPVVTPPIAKPPAGKPSTAAARSMPNFKAEPESPLKKALSETPSAKQSDSSFFKTCTYCDRSFPLDIYVQHESLHKGATVFICDQCNTSFFNELAYKRHVARHQLKKSV